jgi:biotin-dependent carboxylase-like uncharacterized protein
VIEILETGGLASVQDLGRFAAFRWGLGTAGAMDPLALRAANLLLGNPEGAAAIEIQLFPFAVRFEADLDVALTGADCAATLDGAPLLPWSTARARAGQILRLDTPRPGRWTGARACLALRGGIDVPLVLGSRSTQLRGSVGGFEGRHLRPGDRLPVGPEPELPVLRASIVPPALALPLEVDGLPAVRALPAAEHDAFTATSRAAFWNEPWRITPQSDRYGYRLAGPVLEPETPLELRSHGIVPGVVQVPRGGQPIVQMRDGQPSGGYPKIATVIEADLWRLGQMPIGTRFRFLEVDWEGALAAGAELESWLVRLRRVTSLLRARRIG